MYLSSLIHLVKFNKKFSLSIHLYFLIIELLWLLHTLPLLIILTTWVWFYRGLNNLTHYLTRITSSLRKLTLPVGHHKFQSKRRKRIQMNRTNVTSVSLQRLITSINGFIRDRFSGEWPTKFDAPFRLIINNMLGFVFLRKRPWIYPPCRHTPFIAPFIFPLYVCVLPRK